MFTISKRIYYHDTDSEGVVYYANYLKYLEEARTEHLLSLGIDLGETKKEGVLFAVAGIEMRYRGPARYGESISVGSRIEAVKPVSVYFAHRITRDGKTLVEGAARLVSLSGDFKPARIPESLMERLKAA